MTATLQSTLRTVRRGRRLATTIRPGGPDSDLAVLFIHGSGGRKAQWAPLWTAMEKHAATPTLIAWDAPGHGDSPVMRKPGAYTTEAWVEDALALISAHAPGRRLLVAGHSYGTVVALSLMLRLLDGPGMATPVGAALYGPPPPGFRPAGPIVELPLRTLNRMRPALERGFRELAWGPDADPALIDAEELRARGNRLFMMQRLMREAQAPDPAALARLALPIRLVAGADDKLTPPEGAEALSRLLPQASVDVLPRCGHQIMLEKPAEALAALQALLAGS
jgi:abhydrolase domain-containing protein 8